MTTALANFDWDVRGWTYSTWLTLFDCFTNSFVRFFKRTFCAQQMRCMPRSPVGAQRLDTNSSDTRPEWMGFYAFRRGIAPAVATLANAMAAKSVMRHSNLATTTAHYINSEPAEAVRAVDKIGELFDNTNGSGRPN